MHQHVNISTFLECFTGDRIFEEFYCDCIFDSLVKEWQIKALEVKMMSRDNAGVLSEAKLHTKSTFSSIVSKIRELGENYISEKCWKEFRDLNYFLDLEISKTKDNSDYLSFLEASKEIVHSCKPLFHLPNPLDYKLASWDFMQAGKLNFQLNNFIRNDR